MAASPDFWAVELRSTGKLIGQLYLKQIEPAEHLTCELGYILNRPTSARAMDPRRRPPWCDRRSPPVACIGSSPTATRKTRPRGGYWRRLVFAAGAAQTKHLFRRSATGEPLWIDTYVLQGWLRRSICAPDMKFAKTVVSQPLGDQTRSSIPSR